MITLGLATLLLIVIVVSILKNAYDKPDNFPPGPPSLPVYGAYWIVLALGWNNLAGSFSKLCSMYNTKILGLYLGGIPSVIVNDPHMVKEMLFREDFDGRMDILLGRLRAFFKKLGIFFTDGEQWHIQRRFSLRYMRDFGFGRRSDALESVVAHDVKEIIDMRINGPKHPVEKDIVKGDLVHLPHYFAPPFVNGVVSVFTQGSLDRADYDQLYTLARGGLLFQRSSDDLGRALSLTPCLKDLAPNLSGFNNLRKGNQTFIDFYMNIIKDAMETHDETHDRNFLDMYIKRMKEEIRQYGRSTFSVEQLALTCTDYTFPASTANEQVLTMLVEQMLLSPEIQDKIHEEIDRVVGRDRAPTIDDRQNMPYTEACIREMMRFETIVPMGIPHRAVKDTTFAGYDIKENTLVAANYIALHHSKELFGDPENFRPDRFLDNGKLILSKDKSLPFGAGKRLCAGETYARHTLFQVLAGFMQIFHVSTADGKPLKKPYRRIPGIITTLPEFWIKITPRYDGL